MEPAVFAGYANGYAREARRGGAARHVPPFTIPWVCVSWASIFYVGSLGFRGTMVIDTSTLS